MKRKTTGPVFAAAMGLSIAAGATAARPAERFPTLTPDQMTPAQRKVADAIVAGPRKGLGGPFNTWLRSPELADKLQQVGEHLRFHSSLPPRLNEVAILIPARPGRRLRVGGALPPGPEGGPRAPARR